MAAEIPYDLLGLVFGILGVVGLVPLLWAVVRCQLPQHKLKKLDSILEEATALLHSAVQEGFVPSVAFVVEADCVLRNLRGHTENLRADVLSADGIRRQCLAAIKGLSTRVDVICQRVKDLRERIARVSEEERRKAADQERYRPAITSLPVYIQNTLDQRANDTEVGGFDVQARSYHGRKPFALSERLVPWLPMPAPTYTSVTPTFEYEPVRRSSYPDTASLQFSLNGRVVPRWLPSASVDELPQSLNSDWPMSRSPPSYLHQGPPSPLHRFAEPKGTELVPCETTACLDAHPTTDPSPTPERIAELKEQILQDLLDTIGSSVYWQSALERTLQSRLRAQSPSGDAEAGF